MLNRYPLGGMVIRTDKDDLGAPLKRHDEVDEQVGSGIDHVVVDVDSASASFASTRLSVHVLV